MLSPTGQMRNFEAVCSSLLQNLSSAQCCLLNDVIFRIPPLLGSLHNSLTRMILVVCGDMSR